MTYSPWFSFSVIVFGVFFLVGWILDAVGTPTGLRYALSFGVAGAALAAFKWAGL